MSGKRIFAVIFIMAISVAVAFFSLGLKNRSEKPGKKRVSPMYRGLPVKTVRTKSILTSANNKFTIPAVLQGDMVEHDIEIENRMDTLLQLKKVKSCCGFLLNNFTRQIPKNGKGLISLLVLTDRFGGKIVKGTITGETNNANWAKLNVELSLPVEEFAAISQHTIELKGSGKEELIGESRITPLEKYPFKITGLKPKKGYFFDYTYRQVTSGTKKEYVIFVKNTVKKATIYRDNLFIQTDHPARPELMIRVKGKITD